ncbi:MAG: bifunctional precorrin-2 dehydrogenase/sirohydrochlorin ferrochelatase [Acidimicrobiales bacterium]|jgi:siroheme synthase-like protein
MTRVSGPEPPNPRSPARNPVRNPVRHHLLPLVVDVNDLACLVVGAGPVGTRRVRSLLAAGAAVTVVAPHIGDGVRRLLDRSGRAPGPLTVLARPYLPPEASDYRLVVSATGDPAVDAQVVADAVAGGALVNRADTDGAGDGAPGAVSFPAVHRDGPVTVAVSTGGSGPGLASWLRDRAAAALGPDLAVLAGLVDEARAELLARGRAGASVDWGSVLDQVAPLVASGRSDDARVLLGRLVDGSGAAHPGPS